MTFPGRILRLSSMRVRAVILIALVLVPTIAVTTAQSYSQERRLLAAVESDLETQAASAASAQRHLIEIIKSDLAVLAQLPEVRTPLSGNTNCDGTLSAVINASGGRYANLGVVDGDGRVLCSALTAEPGLNLADRDYVQQAMATGEFAAGSFQVGRITGIHSINFAVPTRNLGGSITGVVFAAVPVTYLSEPIANLGLADGTLVSMRDAEGELLFGDGRAGGIAGEASAPAGEGDGVAPVQSRSSGGQVLAVATVTTGQGQIVGSIALAVPRDTVLGPVRSQRRNTILLLSVILAGGIAGGWTGSEFFVVRPARRLIEAAGRIGGGDLTARTGIPHGQGEFGELARALDRMAEDLEERERGLAETETRLGALIDSMTDAVVISDAVTGGVIMVNPAAMAMLGIGGSGHVGMNIGDWLPALTETGRDDQLRPFETVALRADGTQVPVEVSLSFSNQSDREFMTTVARDVTEQRAARAAVERFAYVDRVTELPNRYRLIERLTQSLGRAGGHQLSAVMAIRMYHYPGVVQNFGFTFTDRVEREVGDRIASVIGTRGHAAALGSGQFAAGLEGGRSLKEIEDIAGEIHQAFSELTIVDGRSLLIDLGIGIAYHPAHGNDAETLVRRASLAMMRAGPDETNVFDPTMAEEATGNVELLSQIKEALADGMLELHYQPKVRLSDLSVAGYEALLRWRRSNGELVSPGIFIPVLENSGFMWPVIEWQAGQLAWHAQEMALTRRPLPLALNISARSLHDTRLVDLLGRVVLPAGGGAAGFSVEITETALMSDVEKSVRVCKELADLGVNVSIDDFGAGHSPLAYLGTLEIHEIKIDRSFVSSAARDAKNRAIVSSVAALCRDLGLKSVAEGIETEEEADLMRDLGCDEGQGYYFARPMPFTDAMAWPESNPGENAR